MKPLLILVLATAGCIHEPAARSHLLGAAPPTPAAIASCESTLKAHNTWTVIAAVSGGLSGVGGVAAALPTDPTQRTALGLSSAVLGGISAISTAFSGISSDAFVQKNCIDVLSPQ